MFDYLQTCKQFLGQVAYFITVQWWRENHFTILVAWLNSLVLIEIVQNHSSRVFVYLRFSQNKVYLMTAGTGKLAKFDHFDLLIL